MTSLSMNDKLILVHYAIDEYYSENVLKEKLKIHCRQRRSIWQ